MTILVTLTGAGGGFLLWRTFKKSQTQAWADYAQANAHQIQVRTRDLLAWVERLAEDPRLSQALVRGESKTEAQRLAKLIPEAVKVQILPSQGRWVEEGELGFADLDLVRQAQTASPPPAVHNSPQRHLAVARAIRQEGQVLGVILLDLSLDWLQQVLPDPKSGAIGLYQGELPLVYRGEVDLKLLPPSAIIPIPGTLWQIKYWIPPAPWMVLWVEVGLLVLCLGLIWLAFGWVQRRVTKALASDCAALYSLANDMFIERTQSNYSLNLEDLIPLRDRLLGLKRAEVRHERETAQEESKPMPQAAETVLVQTPLPPKPKLIVAVPEAIFQAGDIRGIVGETITPEIAYELGRAIGSEAGNLGEMGLVVGRDARPSSEELACALIEGLRASGRDVVDLGQVPTPIVFFATHFLPVRSGVVVTAGSDPVRYNGLKVIINQELWGGEKLRAVWQRIEASECTSGLGMLEARDLLADYIGAILDDVQIARPLKVVIDGGAGITAQVVPALLRALGCEVQEFHSQNMFDPFAPSALDRLKAKVQKDPGVDLGLAFDGDGCRLAAIDSSGQPVWPDAVLMLLAADVLSRAPGGDVVFDPECSRHLAGFVIRHGGRPVMTPLDSLYTKMTEVQAVLGGSFDGRVLFHERWFGFADALYAAARLVEVLSSEPEDSASVFADLPKSPATPQLRIDLAPGESDKVLRLLVASADKFFSEAKVSAQAGVRVDFADGFGLVRALPESLAFRFEADDEAALARIQARFREWFETLEIALELPFATRG
ncbi:MAG: hypothetical protein N3A55_02190 [Methylohalobius sp.]|nr:hypothetical protein [Methylohalobius sp.]